MRQEGPGPFSHSGVLSRLLLFCSILHAAALVILLRFRRRYYMAASSVPTSEAAASKTDNSNEGLLDVSALRELAKKALVDALNSVRGLLSERYRSVVNQSGMGTVGEWREDVGS